MKVRYDELMVNDVVKFHGANVKIKSVEISPAPANEWYPNEKSVSFNIAPADDEAIKILGGFYSHGTYGGIGSLTLELVNR